MGGGGANLPFPFLLKDLLDWHALTSVNKLLAAYSHTHIQIQIHPPGKCHLCVLHRYTWWKESHPEDPKTVSEPLNDGKSFWNIQSDCYNTMANTPLMCETMQWEKYGKDIHYLANVNLSLSVTSPAFFLIWIVEVQSLWLRDLLIVSKGGGKQSSDIVSSS